LVEGNGKNVMFAQYGWINVHEDQAFNFNTTGVGNVSSADVDPIDCIHKTGWE
jgi:hypothetical protein